MRLERSRLSGERSISIEAQFELLALRLGVWGPTAATIHHVRPLARSRLWLETRSLLREYGFVESEINHLMGTHPQGCACWTCIRRLRDRIRAHRRKLERSSKKR